MKKANFTSHKQYLFGLLYSKIAEETYTEQSILGCFTLWKERPHNPSQEAAAKKVSCSVYVIGTTSFNEIFLLHKTTGGHYFS